jgi:hypoxanthine phosphoribosyltransferase
MTDNPPPPCPPPSWKGLQTDRMPTFIAYEQVERLIAAMLEDVTIWQPDAVVAIARGGFVPGTMMASMLALPLFILGWNRTTNVTDWIGARPDPGRLLLVDDCCATGQTMKAARAALTGQGYQCATLTVLYDPETTGFVPDFSHPMRELFRFPWERGEATPAARSQRATGAPADRSTERPFYGLDLDGVFLPDITRTQYDTDLADALRQRHELALSPALPPFPRERAVVITGRPEMDRTMTAAWLSRWGFDDLKLECRPETVSDDIVSVARYKAQTATRWGCTHFVESDPEQAIRIAESAPHLVVVWWSAAETRSWVIGAASHADAGKRPL